jgi:hypothetical protein
MLGVNSRKGAAGSGTATDDRYFCTAPYKYKAKIYA